MTDVDNEHFSHKFNKNLCEHVMCMLVSEMHWWHFNTYNNNISSRFILGYVYSTVSIFQWLPVYWWNTIFHGSTIWAMPRMSKLLFLRNPSFAAAEMAHSARLSFSRHFFCTCMKAENVFRALHNFFLIAFFNNAFPRHHWKGSFFPGWLNYEKWGQ